jgi:hypothetical protein
MFKKKLISKIEIYLPPAVGYSFNILFNLVRVNHILPKYIPKILAVFVINLINFPFRLYERLFINPKIKNETLDNAPIFIIGHWRSGTTHLHNVLCQDLQMGFTTTYQSVFPDTLFNKLGLFLFKGFTRLVMPTKREGDNVYLDASFPQEEEFALGDKTPICFYYFWMFPKNLLKYYNDYIRFKNPNFNQIESWKKDYKLLINKSLKNTNKKVYLSKNPPNTGRIKILLEMFPNAKFIHIHRNPIEVFLSTQKFFTKMLPHLQFQSISSKEIDENIFILYKNLMSDYFDQKKNIPEGNLFELSFNQLEEHPLLVLKDLYQGLGLHGFDHALPKFTKYLKSVDSYKKNKHRIKKEHLDTLLAEWKTFMISYNYSVPDTIEIVNEY